MPKVKPHGNYFQNDRQKKVFFSSKNVYFRTNLIFLDDKSVFGEPMTASKGTFRTKLFHFSVPNFKGFESLLMFFQNALIFMQKMSVAQEL
jgi:hypothetical protein